VRPSRRWPAAEAAEMDLVEIRPTAGAAGVPHHEFGKFVFEQKKQPGGGQEEAEAGPDKRSEVPSRDGRRDYQVKNCATWYVS